MGNLEIVKINDNLIGKILYLNSETNTMDMEKFRIYVNDADKFLEFFGEEIVSLALSVSDYKFLDFARKQDIFEAETEFYVKKGYYLGSGLTTIEYERYNKGGWHKTERTRGYSVWVKNQYQDNSKLFRNALLLKYPWLHKFPNLKVYKTCFRNFEDEIFFLNCGDKDHPYDKMLYIYLKDFITGNFVKCMESHINYYKGYYKWPGGWGKDVTEEQVAKWREEHCSIATTPEALRFYSEMELEHLRKNGISC